MAGPHSKANRLTSADKNSQLTGRAQGKGQSIKTGVQGCTGVAWPDSLSAKRSRGLIWVSRGPNNAASSVHLLGNSNPVFSVVANGTTLFLVLNLWYMNHWWYLT